jgi:alpha-1,3-rhamnosyl/mannosyltransferase
MKIRIDVSSLANKTISGVGNYTRLLSEALDTSPNTSLYASYFNFLGRQTTPALNIKQPLEKNSLVPLRVYAKLQSFNIAPAFDIFLKKVDLTIFPNFATWPSLRSSLRATVIHDLTYLRFPEVVEEKNLAHLRRVVPRSIKKADFIITVSETVKNELVEEFGLNPDRCIVTTIPPDSSYAIKNDNEIHQKYNIPTKKYIFFIGNLEPRKDLPTLIRAYRKLPKATKQEYSLVLAGGQGWKTEKSKAAIQQAQEAGDQVIHVGYVDQADASAFYQQASLFVMPSLYEGFGMPILESLSSETPVVASDIPVLREAGGNAAIYAQPQNSDDFSQKILSALTDDKLRAQLINNSKEHLEAFSWSKNVETILAKTSSLLL